MRYLSRSIVLKLSQKESVTEADVQQDVSLSEQVHAYLDAYSWSKFSWWVGETITIDHALERITQEIKNVQENNHLETHKETGEIADGLVALSVSSSFWRAECGMMIMMTGEKLAFLIEDIATANSIAKEDVLLLTFSEMHGLVQKKEMKIANLDEILSRKGEHFVMGDNKGGVIVFGKNDPRYTLLKHIFTNRSTSSETDTLRGLPASFGLIKGYVRVIETSNQFSDFQEGEILVSTETSPMFVPLMRRASAILTGKGGITSHAAIVSRELKKPCIIAIKDIVKILKTGDYVEVDADNGVVKILKSASPATKFVSEDLKDFNTDDYHFCGLWKCGLLGDWYWTQWLVPEYAQKIGLPLEDGGIFVINGGNFFVKNEIFDVVRQYIKDIIDNRNTEKLKELREFTDQIYQSTILEARVLSLKAPSAQITEEITEIGRKIMFPWSFGYLLSEVVDEFLVLLASEEGIKAEDITSLIPTLDTPLFKAQQKLKHIKEILVKRGYWELLHDNSVKAVEVIKNDQDLLNVLNEYSTEYGWTTVMNLMGEDPTVEEVIEQLTHIGETTEPKRESLKQTKNLAFLIDCATTIAYMRQSGVEYFSIYSRDVIHYLKGVSAQLNLPYESLINLNRNEIVAALKGADMANTVESRKNDVWAIYTVPHDEPRVIDDHGQLAILAQRMIPRADGTQDGEIRGQIGNKGRAQGVVKVIVSPEGFSKMEKGNILVSTMTNPDYVPLMQKAAAIVTNIGGLLCHAAIISRELGVPCVIGTKFATQILHDGDLVEVDATNGVVKIIERADTASTSKKKLN